MRKLRILMEYLCYPLWLYTEDELVEMNDLIPELQDHQELKELLESIQKTYNSFFLDTPIEFEYLGPPTKEVERKFMSDLRKAYQLVCDAVGDRYLVQLEMDDKYYIKDGCYDPKTIIINNQTQSPCEDPEG